jgi:hypothetical protein
MRNSITSTIAVLLTFCLVSCATLSNNPGFVAFGACTTQDLETAGKNLLNDIAAVFATSSYEAEALKLIAEVGSAEFQCGVDLYIAEMSAKKSLTKIGSAGLTNAKAYRAAHPV